MVGTKSTNINEGIFSIKSPSKSGIPLTVNIILNLNLRISVKIALCCSHIPLHHGDSAGVVDISILKFSQKSISSSETNPPPLSLNTFDGLPKY